MSMEYGRAISVVFKLDQNSQILFQNFYFKKYSQKKCHIW